MEDTWGLFAKAQAAQRQNDSLAAEEQFRSLTSLSSQEEFLKVSAWAGLAQVLASTLRVPEARLIFHHEIPKATLDTPEKQRVALFAHAMVCFKSGASEKAVNDLESILKLPISDLDKSEAQAFLGWVSQKEGKVDQATNHYRQVSCNEEFVASFVCDMSLYLPKEFLPVTLSSFSENLVTETAAVQEDIKKDEEEGEALAPSELEAPGQLEEVSSQPETVSPQLGEITQTLFEEDSEEEVILSGTLSPVSFEQKPPATLSEKEEEKKVEAEPEKVARKSIDFSAFVFDDTETSVLADLPLSAILQGVDFVEKM